MRRQLRSLQMVLMGASVFRAAQALKAGKPVVERILRTVREAGCSGLPDDGRSAEQVSMRKQIRIALERGPNWRLRKRLVLVDRVLCGDGLEQVASDASISRETLRDWIATFRKGNVQEMVDRIDGRARPIDLDVDAAALRALAAKEKNLHKARRLLALAEIAEGGSMDEAGLRAKVCDRTLRNWIAKLHAEGIHTLLKERVINSYRRV